MKRSIKKIITTIIATTMLLGSTMTSFAAEPNTPDETPPVVVEGTLSAIPEGTVIPEIEEGPMTRAISGSGSHFGNQGTIYVYSPGSSWIAHVKIKTELTNSPIYIACYDPNNRLINPKLSNNSNFVAMSGNNTIGINFNNAPAGTYRLVYAVEDASNALVTFSLHDLIW